METQPLPGLWNRILRRAAGFLLLGLGAAAWPPNLFAQRAPAGALPYQVTVWGSSESLSSNAVNAIAQTPDGYLWLGTETGLVRFDGVRFVSADAIGIPALAEVSIETLLVGRDGGLWVATHSAGVARIRGGQAQIWKVQDGLPSNRVLAFAEDSEGGIWAGTARGAVIFRGERPQPLPAKLALKAEEVSILCPDPAGGIWVGNCTGIELCRGGSLRPFPVPYPLSQLYFTWLCALPGEELWIGTKSGLIHAENGRFQIMGEKEGLLHPNVSFIKPGHDGALWVGTYGGGLQQFRGGTPTPFSTLGRFGDDRILCICEDREGSLWVGTRGAGLVRLRPGGFRTLGTREGLGRDLVYSVLEDRRGDLWAGTVGGGLTRFSGGRAVTYGEKEGLGDNSAHSIFEDRDGSIWAGLDNGLLAHFDGKGFTRYSFQNPALSYKVSAIFRDAGGTLWVGTRGGGIWVKKGDRFELHSPGLPDADLNVHQFLEARDGTLWAASSSGLWVIRGGRLEKPWPEGSPLRALIFCLHEDAAGTLWAGTYGDGLLRIKGGSVTRASVSQGLAENVVYKIVEDSQGAFWMSGNRGISRVSKDDLEGLLDGRRARVAPALFGVAEGLPSSECNGGSHPSGWLLRSGEISFPTTKGLVLFDPRNIRPNPVPPPVVLEDILLNGAKIRPGGGAFPVGRGHLEIRYTALSLANPASIRFRYKLEGYDRQWVEAGGRRVAYYTNLPSGTYRFRVIACNSDGVWNSQGASAGFHLSAPFYSSKGFLFFLLAFAALAAWGLYEFRVRLFQNRSRELENRVAERTAELSAQRDRLEELEQQYRAIVEEQVELVCRYDRRGALTFVNQSLAAFARQAPEALVGANLFQLLPAGLHDVIRAHHASLTPEKPVGMLEVALGSDPQGPRILEWTTRAFFDGGGLLTAYQSVGRDVTRQRRLEQRLLTAQKLEAMGHLAAGVAHDINNLLQAMRGTTSALRSGGASDPSLARTAEDLRFDIDRCAKLAHQLLLLGPRDASKTERVDLNAVVADSESLLQRLVHGNVTLLLDLAARRLPVLLDPGSLEQVMVNLVLNACEAMPRGGRILLRTASQGEQEAILSVSDTGEGISEDLRPRIFEPFFTTKGAEGGTGLGLFVVQGVVERLGGKVEVDSQRGCGSVFKVRLPLADEESLPAPTGVSPDASSGFGGIRTLIVEDEPDVREWLQEALEMLGCGVAAAGTIGEAKTLAGSFQPALVISDYLLPDGSGEDLVVGLQERDPGIAALLTSGYTRVSLNGSAARSGIGFLKKPFSIGELETAMAAALREIRPPPGPPPSSD